MVYQLRLFQQVMDAVCECGRTIGVEGDLEAAQKQKFCLCGRRYRRDQQGLWREVYWGE